MKDFFLILAKSNFLREFLKELEQETLWWVDRDTDTEEAKEEVVDSMAAMRARLEAAAQAK